MKMRKKKAGTDAKDVEERFNRAAKLLWAADDPFVEAIQREPVPDWVTKLITRMARNFSPELKAEDVKRNPKVFEGYSAAASFALAKHHQKIDYSMFPTEVWHEAIRQRFEGMGVLELASEADLLQMAVECQKDQMERELPALRDTIAAALDLPYQEALDFFIAFGDGLKRKTAMKALNSLNTNHTVQICIFVISMRPAIEENAFMNLTELIEFYFFLREKEGVEVKGNDLATKTAFIQQFRRICSSSGLRLSGRGRPRKSGS